MASSTEEYRALIKKLIPFAKTNVLKWRRSMKDRFSHDITSTLRDGEHQGWGIDPFFLLVEEGTIVRLSHDRDYNSRWRDIDIEKDDLDPRGYSSGLLIVTMLDRLATQLLADVPVQVPEGYPLDEVRQVLGWHEADRVAEKPEEKSSRGLIALVAVVPFAFLAVLFIILFLLGARPN